MTTQLILLVLLTATEPVPALVDAAAPRLTSPTATTLPAARYAEATVSEASVDAPAAAPATPRTIRYARPVGPAPQVGYAPQVQSPLPGYPGIPQQAGGVSGYPSRIMGTGSLASLYTDLKASAPGDVLTIVITQQAVAAANAKKTDGRTAGISFNGGAGLLQFLPSFGIDFQSGHEGKSDDTSGFNVSTRFTVVVKSLTEAGNLLVEGEQQVEMNGRPQWVKIQGEVRPYDVNPDNTIESTKVANVHIEFVGVRAPKKHKGLFDMIGGALEGLFGIFF